mgnify:FL=1|jgi:V/A-type H+-transporting ATPase subunit C
MLWNGEAMSDNLLEYSGLVTKTKAMSGRLLKEADYARLMEYETVDAFLGFLKESYGYAPIFAARDEIAHRGQVETVIRASLYADYKKLYQFAHGEQRAGLELIFFRYEIDGLKECLKYALSGERAEAAVDVSFLEEYAGFDVRSAAAACSMEELIVAVTGTAYERLFRHMAEQETIEYADAAVTLDIYYYKTAWKKKEKLRDPLTRNLYDKLLGTEIDWQNRMWIYRLKRFYGMNGTELASHLIPITCHMKKDELRKMTETDGMEVFSGIEEESGQRALEKAYTELCKKYPMSLAPVFKYLYDKEQEIDHLTSILEGIRYQLLPGDIRKMVFAI